MGLAVSICFITLPYQPTDYHIFAEVSLFFDSFTGSGKKFRMLARFDANSKNVILFSPFYIQYLQEKEYAQ